MGIFLCERCNKLFRDSFNLERHTNKIKLCKKVVVNEKKTDIDPTNQTDTNQTDTSGNITVNNNYTLNLTIIKSLGNEDLSHIHPIMIIDKMREINRNSDENDYKMAGQMVIDFHGLVNENKVNCNVVLPNIRSPVVKVVTETGVVVKQRTNDVVDRLVKTRAKQLTGFKESIDQTNPLVFKSNKIRKAWTQLEGFGGTNYPSPHSSNDTRDIRTKYKVELLN